MALDDQFLMDEEFGAGGISGLDPLQIREVLALLADPKAALAAPELAAEWVKILLGLSDVEVPERDAQYRDKAWREHPIFRRLAQGHLAWAKWVEDRTERDEGTWENRERARYVTNIVTGALSPANLPMTNPAAIRKAVETGGRSLLRGARTFVRDVATNGGMPHMTDPSPFTVGLNVATSAGAVVYREEMFELIQYSPTTEKVHERPLLFVPPQLGRYYILDLAPQRSLVEQAVSSGMQTFMLVWRNPRKDRHARHGEWGFEDYMSAVARAFAVVTQIAGTDDLNLVGFCAGGVTSALTQAYLAARGENPIHCATYLVTMLDTRRPNLVTPLTTRGVSSELNKLADKAAVIDAKRIADHWAWLRPNDLVFGHVINNWLLGEEPSAYDLLAWNDDQSNLTAKFVADTTALMASGVLVKPGGVTLLDTEIDLSQVKVDTFVVAAQTDHITTWRPCYMTSQVLGGDSEVVIVNKGHIQTLVSPIAKSRQKYWAGRADVPDPDAWIRQTEQRAGSWWPHWIEWLAPRAGEEKPSPERLGSLAHPAREPAPGRYVLEK
ncbi:PHA/PHB synthase family protein [Tsukamurella soli]|uniref:Class II poly(R)-hydroxyalkanoic acid synthase n=1 Tax=Tsukamurella soli TaxID=644556 RepID=A0ABP8JTY6_9ACTN